MMAILLTGAGCLALGFLIGIGFMLWLIEGART